MCGWAFLVMDISIQARGDWSFLVFGRSLWAVVNYQADVGEIVSDVR